jgi:D-sedoheptulose 7-phosphate isomerase
MSASLSTPCGYDHVNELLRALDGFDQGIETASEWGRTIAAALTDGRRLLAAGNGGSAAQAQHLTGELVGRYREDRPPFSAICLSAETSTLTAIMNDYPVEELFARQVEAHGRRGDVLVLMSTSGRSPNVVTAAQRGRHLGLTVLAFTGPRPNPLADIADHAVSVESPFTATVQELHLVGLHILCASMDRALGVTAVARAALEDVPDLHSAASTRALM